MSNDKTNDDADQNDEPDLTISTSGTNASVEDDSASYAKTVRHEIQHVSKTVVSTNTDIVEGYQIISMLGEGGMGVVYLANQRSLSRRVALKLMKDMGDDESFVARFRREAITGARLNHPNIVSVYDHGHIEGKVFLVLEYVKGRNCSELIEQTGRFQVKTVLEIMRGCVLGLSHAEKLGVIHRDIKPANIMILEEEGSDARRSTKAHPKIADFGLARLHDRDDPEHIDLTQTGSIMGTPGYMAPEQALGHEVDFRADIYSLGSTMYCLLTGSKPFTGATMVEVLHKKLNEQAPNPQDLVGEISNEVILVLDRMMAKKREDRYQTYEDLLIDLEALIDGEVPKTKGLELLASSLDVGGLDTRKKLGKGKTPGGRGKKAKILAVVGGVALALGAAWVVWPAEKEVPAVVSQDPNVAKLNALLEEWGGDSPGIYFSALERRSVLFDEELKRVSGNDEKTRLEEDFRTILADKLARNEDFVLSPLEADWKARKWKSMALACGILKGHYQQAGLSIPARLSTLDEYAGQAQLGNMAKVEEEAIAKLMNAEPSKATLDELLAFSNRFPFSPSLSWVKQEILRIQPLVRAAEQSRPIRLDSVWDQLVAQSPRAFIEAYTKMGDEWKRELADVPSSKRKNAEERLRELLKDNGELVIAETTTFLTQLWTTRDYVRLRALLDDSATLIKRIGLEEPESWEQFHRVASASKDRLGLQEKMAWKAITSEKDALLRVQQLEDYIAEFASFSPTIDAARSMYAADCKKAPALIFDVEPESASITVNGIQLKKSDWNGHHLPEDLEVSITAPGYFESKHELSHQGEKTELIVRLIKKSRNDVSIDLSKNANVPLSVDPRNSRKSPFPFAKGLQQGVATEEAGLRVVTVDKKRKKWWSTSRSLFDNMIGKVVFPQGEEHFWQLHGRLIHQEGAMEVRLLNAADDRSVVLGIHLNSDGKKEFYFGERQDKKLDVTYKAPITNNESAIRFSLSWYGDICVLGVCDTLEGHPAKARILASINYLHPLGKPQSIALAASQGGGIFAELKLYPMQ